MTARLLSIICFSLCLLSTSALSGAREDAAFDALRKQGTQASAVSFSFQLTRDPSLQFSKIQLSYIEFLRAYVTYHFSDNLTKQSPGFPRFETAEHYARLVQPDPRDIPQLNEWVKEFEPHLDIQDKCREIAFYSSMIDPLLKKHPELQELVDDSGWEGLRAFYDAFMPLQELIQTAKKTPSPFLREAFPKGTLLARTEALRSYLNTAQSMRTHENHNALDLLTRMSHYLISNYASLQDLGVPIEGPLAELLLKKLHAQIMSINHPPQLTASRQDQQPYAAASVPTHAYAPTLSAAAAQPSFMYSHSAAAAQPPFMYSHSAAAAQPPFMYSHSAAAAQPPFMYSHSAAAAQPSSFYFYSPAPSQASMFFHSPATASQASSMPFHSAVAVPPPAAASSFYPPAAAAPTSARSFHSLAAAAQPSSSSRYSPAAAAATTTANAANSAASPASAPAARSSSEVQMLLDRLKHLRQISAKMNSNEQEKNTYKNELQAFLKALDQFFDSQIRGAPLPVDSADQFLLLVRFHSLASELSRLLPEHHTLARQYAINSYLYLIHTLTWAKQFPLLTPYLTQSQHGQLFCMLQDIEAMVPKDRRLELSQFMPRAETSQARAAQPASPCLSNPEFHAILSEMDRDLAQTRRSLSAPPAGCAAEEVAAPGAVSPFSRPNSAEMLLLQQSTSKKRKLEAIQSEDENEDEDEEENPSKTP